MESTFNASCLSSSVTQSMLGLVDVFNYQLTSPLHTPDSSFVFEIEPDRTTYETCYDEFMEFKLTVIQEIFNRGKVCLFISLRRMKPMLFTVILSSTCPLSLLWTSMSIPEDLPDLHHLLPQFSLRRPLVSPAHLPAKLRNLRELQRWISLTTPSPTLIQGMVTICQRSVLHLFRFVEECSG